MSEPTIEIAQPTPADMPAQAPESEAPPAKAPRTLEEVEAELTKTRSEAAKYRNKLREVEPLAKEGPGG